MRYALDTNAIIDICQNEVWLDLVTTHFSSSREDALVLVSQAMCEVQLPLPNIARLEEVSILDTHRYFTISESLIGGPDTIRSNEAVNNRIQRHIHVSEGYEDYRQELERQGKKPKDAYSWNQRNNHQADAVIYEQSTDAGCDVLVTSENYMLTRIPAGKPCRPMKLSEFITILDSGLPQSLDRSENTELG